MPKRATWLALALVTACHAPAAVDLGRGADASSPSPAKDATAALDAQAAVLDAQAPALDAQAPPGIADASTGDATTAAVDAAEQDAAPSEPTDPPLEIEFLGVGGFSMRRGGDLILTAPLYSNPPLNDVLTGQVHSDRTEIDRFLPSTVADAKAILVGHAHYDHLMDVPYVLERTPDALVYGNLDAKRLLAAFAPDKNPACPTSTASLPLVPRSRVIAVNDPADDRVDYRSCAQRESSCTGAWDGSPGDWIPIPSSQVRIRALCSSHPDQFLFFHLGAGCVDAEPCAPPPSATDWREGLTVAYLIDFLDPSSGAPVFRVYYQDAPTNGPVGYPHPDLLLEKRVDVALLCTGNYDQVSDQPQDTIAALSPRYVIAGHWESFFRSRSQPIVAAPFTDIGEYLRRMTLALTSSSAPPAGSPLVIDGQPVTERGVVKDPGTRFVITR